MPKRVIFRNRSFITFVDRPVLARSNALGLLHPYWLVRFRDYYTSSERLTIKHSLNARAGRVNPWGISPLPA